MFSFSYRNNNYLSRRCFSPLKIPGVSTIEIACKKTVKFLFGEMSKCYQTHLQYGRGDSRALESIKECVSVLAEGSKLLFRVDD